METSKRARRRKPDTGQGGPEATIQQYSGGQGVHHVAESKRGMESEGLEEKYRAVRSSRQGCESCEVKVLAPPVACSRAASLSNACEGNDARSAWTKTPRLPCKENLQR